MKCRFETLLESLFRWAINKYMAIYWGRKCSEFEPNCGLCKAHRAVEVILGED